MDVNEMYPLYDRELSWVSFNGRVLQEAADERVPLHERLKFLAIFSSNLDEFFRVRVAGIRSLMSLGKKRREKLSFDPAELLAELYRRIDHQQEEFGRIFKELLVQLRAHGVSLLHEEEVSEEQLLYLRGYFRDNVRPFIDPVLVGTPGTEDFLRNRTLYLMVDLRGLVGNAEPEAIGCVTIPTEILPRFVALPSADGMHVVMFLDDVIRMNCDTVFEDWEVRGAWSVKLSRDADLHIEDEFSGDLVKKITLALSKRETGAPARFLYDPAIPSALLRRLRRHYGLKKEDLFPGGRYHNFHDLFSFPNPVGDGLRDPVMPPLRYQPFLRAESMFDAVRERDHILHFPYMSFDPVVRLLEEAALDDAVEEISITLYRIASHSAIARALIDAATNGKRVHVFMEIKARFDEESNIYWSERLTEAGAMVTYSIPGLKVHAKMYRILRREQDRKREYVYLGTGNFNEKTAGLYCDHGYFSARKSVAKEVSAVFDILAKRRVGYEFSELLVAQFNMRGEINRMIDREITLAKEGGPAAILMKMNSLEDPKIIRRLYRASRAGVRVTLIVRGICCLLPGVEGLSENIHVRSIVDRYLEHARVYVFHNGGSEEMYLASADMMRRNLNRRIEVGFPLRDPALKEQVRAILDLQLRDNVKARLVDEMQQNSYLTGEENREDVRAQVDAWHYLASLPDVESPVSGVSADHTD
ncbi:MAG: polyphosphate kinase 1 [Bacteroidota bacterium]|nr:polyphosphate kinase 1 [Bacteroidota bacterium]